MEAQAFSKFNRISASKARLVANEVRGEELLYAIEILKAMPQKSARLILKTIYSAGANAKYKKPDVMDKDLYVKKIVVDVGPTMKRFRPRARGRANRIKKRTSSILIVLSDEN
ncbi:MAG TPA: 50S ribosomal protein L22 [Spirochaetota bacterium]|nr:50S ribosomal protein L22 [Spirochaetota bacterium]HPC41023.1 50S ribosomal protein L22 [Spirochaetota bacterium]HPL16909.1 50S ribosomal protein L22 [Spirochaetota bacterium]HQF08864.1 50S ribosomal protein L22 [Spirochaetota bacterium]HQH97483.1 50S ribosomal protein L22 [Spirochaetota bacterium]